MQNELRIDEFRHAGEHFLRKVILELRNLGISVASLKIDHLCGDISNLVESLVSQPS